MNSLKTSAQHGPLLDMTMEWLGGGERIYRTYASVAGKWLTLQIGLGRRVLWVSIRRVWDTAV